MTRPTFSASEHPAPRKRVILQSEAAECGLACLANILSLLDRDMDLSVLRRQFPISMKGTTLATLLHIGQALGLNGRAYRADLEVLADLRLPALLHWNMSHFVVLERVTVFRRRRLFHIIDPAAGRLRLDEAAVSRSFTGVVAEFEPTAAVFPAVRSSRLRIWDLWSESYGLFRSLARIGILTLISEMLLLTGPMFAQVAIDTVLPGSDRTLLFRLGVIFGLLAALAGITTWLREAAIAFLGQIVSYQVSINVTRHLFNLPMFWFSRRQVADVISRLSSTTPIAEFISKSLFSLGVSVISFVICATIIAQYSVNLTWALLLTTCGYGLVKLALVPMTTRRTAEALQAQASETGLTMESLRGMASIKAYGVEYDRLALWTNRKANAVSASLRLAAVENIKQGLQPTAFALNNVFFTIIAIDAVIEGRLTLGMAVASALYQQHAFIAASTIVDKITAYFELSAHLERVGDIVSEPPDSRPTHISQHALFAGELELQQVHFSYGIGETEVLRGINFTVRPGETVCLCGPSGCGKSTLLQVALGLLQPSSGRVLLDGLDIASRDGSWRSEVGYVSQDDQLFEGSLADNISFFDPMANREKIMQAASLAIIHDDIVNMPMAYETLVGDMGSTLSGGQKARVLLARALYRSPKLLVIDEGSAHLDSETETILNRSLSNLKITRLIVAHRKETIAMADRVLKLRDGEISN